MVTTETLVTPTLTMMRTTAVTADKRSSNSTSRRCISTNTTKVGNCYWNITVVSKKLACKKEYFAICRQLLIKYLILSR